MLHPEQVKLGLRVIMQEQQEIGVGTIMEIENAYCIGEYDSVFVEWDRSMEQIYHPLGSRVISSAWTCIRLLSIAQ